MSTTQKSFPRHYELDWLRVIAIILVLYFHVAMIFTEEWGWHIKNDELSYLWLEFNFWLSQFRMPLLFLISGVGSYFALRKRSGWQYLKERHHRLVIPLVFAMFVIVPPQIYFERIFNGESYASFFFFYPSVLEFIPYPTGNFSWHHMWFVAYLFIYSAIGLPLFLALKSEKGKLLTQALVHLLNRNGIYLLALPTIFVYAFWTVRFPRTNDLISDFGWLPYWFTFFLAGYLLACQNGFWKQILRQRKRSLQLAVISIVAINTIRWNGWEPEGFGAESLAWFVVRGANAWFWLFALLGYARKYLNRPSPFLRYANEGIYPFYILHQTVIVMVGYYVVTLVSEGILAKYLFISTVSLLLTVAIYDFFIKPMGVIRFLFGMKNPIRLKQKSLSPTNNEKVKEEVGVPAI